MAPVFVVPDTVRHPGFCLTRRGVQYAVKEVVSILKVLTVSVLRFQQGPSVLPGADRMQERKH